MRFSKYASCMTRIFLLEAEVNIYANMIGNDRECIIDNYMPGVS